MEQTKEPHHNIQKLLPIKKSNDKHKVKLKALKKFTGRRRIRFNFFFLLKELFIEITCVETQFFQQEMLFTRNVMI